MNLSRMIPALAAAALFAMSPTAFAAQPDTPAHKEIAPHSSPNPQTDTPISGKVIESIDSGGYTYVQLKNDAGNTIWVAVPPMKVMKGEEIAFQPGNIMPNFNSPTLKRTFETLILSPGPMVLPGTKADKSAAKPSKPQKIDKVTMAEGTGAATVEGCYNDGAKLDGKVVTVRGKVVKVSPRIMGTNWVHIQDGTGDSAKGTHDLVVTTGDLPANGDVVTATGTLAKDKDFGYGYKFDVIVENASLSK